MNSINRILLFFGLLVLSQLSLAQPEKNLQDEKKRLEFDKHFFEGMKEKMIQNYEKTYGKSIGDSMDAAFSS
jgi:hypothetical protein